MSRYSRYTFLSMALLIAALSACSKKSAEEAAEAPAAEVATETAPAADPSQEEADKQAAKVELAKKQAQLDYATMEDTYINAPKAQWASSAKASSGCGQELGQIYDHCAPDKAAGQVDGKSWQSNSSDVGFDWLEVGFEKPVHATEVRFALADEKAVMSASKIELIAADGTKHEVWSGVNDVTPDSRGQRTWFVKQFEATPYQVVGAKLSLANNMASGMKSVDAVQIVGE